MGLYNFQTRFKAMVLDGSKRHTIRGVRKYPQKVGDRCYLYTGLRTKNVEFLFHAPCTAMQNIVMEGDGTEHGTAVWVDGALLAADERDELAWSDGFRPDGTSRSRRQGAFGAMAPFWSGRLPFHGHIIHWDYERRNTQRPGTGGFTGAQDTTPFR